MTERFALFKTSVLCFPCAFHMILEYSRDMVSQLLLLNNMLLTYQGVVTSPKHSEKSWSSYVCFGLLAINKTGCRVLVWERCSQFFWKKKGGLIDFNHWFLSFPVLIVSNAALILSCIVCLIAATQLIRVHSIITFSCSSASQAQDWAKLITKTVKDAGLDNA